MANNMTGSLAAMLRGAGGNVFLEMREVINDEVAVFTKQGTAYHYLVTVAS